MKFDYDKAWRETMSLLKANAGLLAVIAGVFFFLPYVALMVGLPGINAIVQPDPAASPDAMMGAMMDFYRTWWWLLLIVAILQGIGMLAMLALLRRRANPTVGEALTTGAKAVIPYICAQLLASFAIAALVLLLVGGVSLTGSTALMVLAGIAAFVLVLYAFTKLSMVAPVIAIDETLNPIAALRQSWALTKGNSVRLFFFYALILVAFAIAGAVLSAVLNLGFALSGEQVALFGAAVVSATLNAALVLLFVGVLAAVHSQLVRLRAHAADSPDV